MHLFSALNVGEETTSAGVAAAIAAALANLPNKVNARVSTTAALPALTATTQTLTVNADGPLAAQDGVTLVLDDRIVVRHQVAGAQNGLFYQSQVGVTPVQQVETATVVGTIVVSGDAAVTVTSALLFGGSFSFVVAVLNGDTASDVAGKIRAIIESVGDIGDFYTASGATDKVILTAINDAANDATLNIAIDNDTCTGLTAAPTSANTTAGVLGLPAVLTRTDDANTWAELAGMIVKVNEGSTLADHLFQCTNNAGGTLGTTAVVIEDITLKLANATTAAAGVTRYATGAETVTGSVTDAAVTPAGLTTKIDAWPTTTFANGAAIQSDATDAHTLLFRGWDTNAALYRTFITITNGNTPTCAIAAPSGGVLTVDATTLSSESSVTLGNGASAGSVVIHKGNGATATILATNITTPRTLESPDNDGTLFTGRYATVDLGATNVTVAAPALNAGEYIAGVSVEPSDGVGVVYSGYYSGNLNFSANANTGTSPVRVVIAKI